MPKSNVIVMTSLRERLLGDDRLPAADVVEAIESKEAARVALRQLSEAMALRPEALFRARMLRLGELIVERHPIQPSFCREMLGCRTPATLRQGAFAAVGEAVARSVELAQAPRPAAVLPDQVVWVTTPVRLDFAGGWSDTPPISTEVGGTVVNAAITLNGQYPVQVMAKLNQDGVIRLSSIDLGQRLTIGTTAELLNHGDPTHWAALPKAALMLAGIGPSRPEVPLRKWLEVLGGGLDLNIFSALPKGSGLGTSSILGTAVLACLGRILGEPFSSDRLIALTSILEQRMCTGGGWQDQIGGIIPGVKLIRTQRGADQSVSLSWAVFDLRPGSALRERTLLYYTGQKRMARNILHNVVRQYLARDPATLRTIAELKDAALEMKADLDSQNVDAFARGIERYWTLKKQIDPGSTNPQIEALLKSVNRWTAGRMLPGAGGGGFIFLVARDPDAARQIRRRLTESPPNRLARFFDFDVDQTGVKVTVL
jgi:galactokinase/mevalonate kinase-like predicted kinase